MKKRALVLSCVLLLLLSVFALAACNNNTKEEYDYASDPIIGTYIGELQTGSESDDMNGYYLSIVLYQEAEPDYPYANHFLCELTVGDPPHRWDEDVTFVRNTFTVMRNKDTGEYVCRDGQFAFSHVGIDNEYEVYLSADGSTIWFKPADPSSTGIGQYTISLTRTTSSRDDFFDEFRAKFE